MTLLQIAGSQTWPNFLPLLGYRPSGVVFLTSADSKGVYAQSIAALRTAAASLPQPMEFQTGRISTPGENPTLQDCRDTLRQLDPHSISLINLTGGTKAMSLAAFLFAQEHRIPSFHLDTRRSSHPFDDCGTAPHLIPFPTLSSLSLQINVRTALQCQGFPVPSTFKNPPGVQLEFARAAALIRADEAASKIISSALSDWRARLHTENSSKFLAKGQLRSALQKPVSASPGTAWNQYLTAAAKADLVEPMEPGGEFLLTSLDPLTANADELRSEAQNRFKLLEGLWFELAVLDHLRTQSQFSDVQWSVEPDPSTGPAASSKGETDLVAFNHESLNLHFISCKTTGPHSSPLDHIQGLSRRATKEGGQYAKAELWLFRPKDARQREDLANHCREQGVTFRVFTELP